MPKSLLVSRRGAVRLATMACASLCMPEPLRALGRSRRRMRHPTPRPNYTADKVLKADKLGGDKELIALFDGVRRIPHIVDGIGCTCGCAEQEGYYSLLTCYETDEAMSKWCPVCIGLGQLVVRLHARGRNLEQIREAVDARN